MGARLARLWRLLGDDADARRPGLRRRRAGPGAPAAARPWRQPPPRRSSSRRRVARASTALLRALVALGYRREHQVEHRGEVAVRGGIVDVFPSTADGPVRIDLFGDEVERLTAFDLGDQRSIDDLDEVVLFACRELVARRPTMRARAAELAGHRAFGPRASSRGSPTASSSTGWRRGCPGCVDGETLLTDLLGADDPVVLVEPARVATGPRELLDEEAALAEALADDLGRADAGDDRAAALHVGFDRLLAGTPRASVLLVLAVPEGPDVPTV